MEPQTGLESAIPEGSSEAEREHHVDSGDLRCRYAKVVQPWKTGHSNLPGPAKSRHKKPGEAMELGRHGDKGERGESMATPAEGYAWQGNPA